MNYLRRKINEMIKTYSLEKLMKIIILDQDNGNTKLHSKTLKKTNAKID